jgi:transcriptional regulator with XRE-family HTH domain
MTENEIQRQRLAERLKEYRKLIGMSQKELAEKLGKAQTVISSWEVGTGMPDAVMLPKLSKALGVSLADLCGLTDAKSSDEELLDAYHRADKTTQKNIRVLLGIERS